MHTKTKHIFFALVMIALSFGIVYAHIAIPSAPTTACESLDSTNMRVHASNQIDDRIALAASSTGLSLFTSRPTSTSTPWTRNPDAWTAQGTSLDFTGVSPWNYDGGYVHYTQGGTLISPRHFLAANHYSISVGSVVGFIDADGNHVERIVAGSTNIAGTDIQVELLDSDVPDSITYYPLIASSTLKSLLQIYDTGNIDVPIVIFDQEAKALVRNLTSLSDTSIGNNVFSSGSSRADFGEYIISGDSGQPGFLIVDNRPVLLFSNYASTTSPNYGSYISEINSAMTSLGGGYQVTEYTQTCFTEHSINHIPVFDSASGIFTRTSTSSDSIIHTFTATDADSGQTLTYSLSALSSVDYPLLSLSPSDYFTINSSTGSLYQTNDIDKDTVGQTLTLTVKVDDNGTNVASTTQDFSIDIRDVLSQNGRMVFDPYFALPTVDASLNDLIFDSNNKLIVTGSYSQIAGQSQKGIARLNTDGTFDTDFDSAIGAGITDGGGTISAGALAIDSNQKIYASLSGTAPIAFDGVTTGKLIRLNADATLDTDYITAEGTGFPVGIIYSLDNVGDKLIVSALATAGFDGSSNTRLFMINSDGSLDTNFHTNFGSFNSLGPRKVVYADGSLYVGGQFTTYTRPDTTTVTQNYITKLSSDGTLDEDFATAIGTGFDTIVYDMAALSTGQIVVVGNFTTFNGSSAPKIALLNTDGTLDTDFMSNISDGFTAGIFAVAVQDGDKILLGGNNNTFNGTTTKGLIRLNSDGTLDTNFKNALGDGVNGGISKIDLRSDGAIGMVGNLLDYNGTSVDNYLLILTTETPDAPSTPDLETAYDSGSSNSDNNTTETTQVFSGTGAPSATLNLYSDGVLVDTSTVNDDGVWYATTTLSVGSYSISASQTLDFATTATSTVSSALSLVVSQNDPGGSSSGGGGGGSSSKNNTTPSNQTVCAPGEKFSPQTGKPCTTTILTNPNCLPGYLFDPTNGIRCPVQLANDTSVPFNNSVPEVDLTLGSVGESVRWLQRFLNSRGFVVSYTGDGSINNETTYFGIKTRSALAKYQLAVGIKPSLGYFGPLTRKYLREH